jgi:hypothetical protein
MISVPPIVVTVSLPIPFPTPPVMIGVPPIVVDVRLPVPLSSLVQLYVPPIVIVTRALSAARLRNLFRGQCIGVSVDQQGDDCIITLDLEDYNRLPPLINVGAPSGFSGDLPQADGTVILLDPRGALTGATQAFKTFSAGGYWPDLSPKLDLVSGFLAPEVPGSPLIDESVALTDLKSFVDDQAPRVSGALRWWLTPPEFGDGLVLMWVDYLDPVETALLPAPFDIDNDAPNWTTSLLPIKLGPFVWNWANVRGSVYVRGGTPAPAGSGWATGVGSSPWGDAYINAPGSITALDAAEIGLWHQNRDFIEQMTSSAILPGSLGPTTFIGWRIGQTTHVTSAVHSRLAGASHQLAARPTVVQKVTGRMVSPAGGLGIAIDGVPLTLPFEWMSLTFESILGSGGTAASASAGKATVVLHLLGEAGPPGPPSAPSGLIAIAGDGFVDLSWDAVPEGGPGLTIAQLADVWITLNDLDPADFEWNLEIGDVPAGLLSREFAKLAATVAAPPVTYRFTVGVKDPDGVKAGGSSQVSAQIGTGAESPVALPGVPMEWVLLQFTDAAQTSPGALLELIDATGTTDSGGRVFTTLQEVSGSSPLPANYNWEVVAVALPVA